MRCFMILLYLRENVVKKNKITKMAQFFDQTFEAYILNSQSQAYLFLQKVLIDETESLFSLSALLRFMVYACF